MLMKKFMSLPVGLLEELSENEMILVLGGDASILAVNNGLGKCDGINNAGGTCSGEANNGDGRCDNGKVNNGNGLCGVLPPPPNPGIDKPVITG